jgi:hypothetical protein
MRWKPRGGGGSLIPDHETLVPTNFDLQWGHEFSQWPAHIVLASTLPDPSPG